MGCFDVQRVGDGVLVTITPGEATIWFDSRHDAAALGTALLRIAAFGADVLDDPTLGAAASPGHEETP